MRPLLWFDCVAAAIAGTVMLTLGGVLASLFGLSRALLAFMGIVNLAYGAFSFSLARRPTAPRRRVKALIGANAAWAVLCVAMAAHLADSAGRLGTAYILAEAVFVGALAVVEARTLSR